MSADLDVRLRKILKRLSRSPRDRDAWGNLYDLMWPSIVAEAYSRLNDDAMKAPDVAHEVFMCLARTPQPRLLQEPRAFLEYVSSLVLKVSRDVRQRATAPEMEEGEREKIREMLREVHETPYKASQKLPAEELDVLEQYIVETSTYKEFAERYHVPEEAVKKLVIQTSLHLRIITGRFPDDLPISGDLE